MSRGVLVLGATSAIAQTLTRWFARDGDRLVLAARDAERLQTVADDLRVRGAASVTTHVLDLDDLDRHAELIDRAWSELEGIDVAVLAYGVLGDAQACRQDPRAVAAVLQTDLVGPASLLTLLASRMEERGSGTLVGISSVAGDRGRQSNYVYGAAKGGLTLLLSGLRNRLHPHGVRVLTVKPGFVDTPMTAHLDKGPLFASSQQVASGIYRALRSGRDVVYLPWFWRPILWAIRLIPEPLFKRLPL